MSSERYTSAQIDTLLNLYFRDHPRQTPWHQIAETVDAGVEPKQLKRLLWGIITGYSGHEADGPRRGYIPTRLRTNRAGLPWYRREDDALLAALSGEGQKRQPPCDIWFITIILMRPAGETLLHWNEINPGRDKLNRTGFGLEKKS